MKHLNFCLTAILFFLFFSSTNSFSQVAINTNGAVPNSSAMLDIQSTTKGLLIPTMTLTQRDLISSAATGLLIFQTDNTPGFYFYTGSGWTLLGGTGGAITGSGTSNYLTFWNGTNSVTGNSCLMWNPADSILQITGRVYQSGFGYSNFFGYQAGKNDDRTNNYNSAFGYVSLYSNSTGEYNSAFGGNSLFTNTAGYNNSAFGNYSLYFNSTGHSNTAVGGSAGQSYTGGFANSTSRMSVYLGYGTRAYNNGDENEIVIGYDATGVGSNSVVLGNSSITKTILRGSIGLGTEYPNSSSIFDMTSTSKGLLIPRMTQTQRNAISTPATGLLIYQTDNTPGFYYYNSSSWTSVSSSGTITGSGTSGYVTFWNGTNTVTGNTNLFWDATNNRLGINTSSPNAPLQVNGRVYQDGLNFSTFFGYNAGANQDGSGDRNVAVGYNSLTNLTSGDHNTALGTDAGGSLTTGTNSVFLGSQTSPSSTGNTNEIVIGYGTIGLGSNSVVLGNSSITNTYLRGTVAIGNTSPSTQLDVSGNARFRSVGSGTYSTALNLTSDGTLTTSTSDVRLKTNIENLKNSLDKILKLQGVSFNWKSNPEDKKMIGFIAQEVEKVVPEVVFTNPVDGYKGINYAEMTSILVEGMKEQQSKINDLEDRITKLENKNQVADYAGFSGNSMLWVFLSACVITAGIIRFKKINKLNKNENFNI